MNTAAGLSGDDFAVSLRMTARLKLMAHPFPMLRYRAIGGDLGSYFQHPAGARRRLRAFSPAARDVRPLGADCRPNGRAAEKLLDNRRHD